MLLAKVRVRQRQSLADIPVSRPRNGDSTRFSEALQACRDIHSIAEQVRTPNHHIANVDADPELKAAILRPSGARFPEPLLDRHRALNSIHGARKLCENAIASGVGDPASMLGDEAVHDLASGSQGAQGPGLVLAHQARVPGHVRRKDRRKTPFDPLFVLRRHRFTLPLRHRAAEGAEVQGSQRSVRSRFPTVAIGLKLRRTLETAVDGPPR
jgi:hypothetical protein